MSRKDALAAADNVSIDYNHYKVHDGQMYSANYSFGITTASNLDIMIVTATDEPHIVLEVEGTGQALIKFYEGITSSANGTTIPVYNFDRNSSNTTTVAFFQGSTWSTNSEVTLKTIIMPGGSTPQTRIGGQSRTGIEWELKASTKYLVRLANQAGTTNTVSFNAEYYQE
jgi:hypothetical protein